MPHSAVAIVARDNGENIMEVSQVFGKTEIRITKLNMSDPRISKM
jgi:hypothetical protein